MTYPRRDRLIFDTPHDARHYDHDPYSSRATIPVPMPPGADILARRLSDVSEAELKEVLRFTESGGHKNYYAKPVARLIVELVAKAVLNTHGGRVYASAVDFEQDPVGQYALFNVLFAWYVPDSKIKGGLELGALTQKHPCIWADLIDIVRIALEKSATPPPKPSRDDEILDRLQQLEGVFQQQQSATLNRLQQVEGMLQQQQSATLALTTMCGWLLRSIPPTVWESGGAETVRLIGELADAVAPWADENPAAAEVSLRAARAVGAPQAQTGPAPAAAKPCDAVKTQVETHSGKPKVAAEPLDDDKVQADTLKTQSEAFVSLERAIGEVIERSGGKGFSVIGYHLQRRVFLFPIEGYGLQRQPGVTAYDLLRRSIRSKLGDLYLEGTVVDKIRFDGRDNQGFGVFVDALGPFLISTADISI